jgi:hypothetical protein
LLLQNTKIINKPDFIADNLGNGIAGYYFYFTIDVSWADLLRLTAFRG